MTNESKLEMVKTILNVEGAELDHRLMTYLDIAKREILSWRYPYGTTNSVTEVPEALEMSQIYAVIAGFTQVGAEGETQHNENGVNRTFAHADMLAYIRANVIPLCKVL